MIATVNNKDRPIARRRGSQYRVAERRMHLTGKHATARLWPIEPDSPPGFRPEHPSSIATPKFPNSVRLGLPLTVKVERQKPVLQLLKDSMEAQCHPETMPKEHDRRNRLKAIGRLDTLPPAMCQSCAKERLGALRTPQKRLMLFGTWWRKERHPDGA